MKRKTLSQKELDIITELRQRGISWLGIEKQTNIPRYVAKREYELWQSRSTADELRGVRLRLAEQQFKQHVNDLMTLADWILQFIEPLHWPYNLYESANNVIDRMLSSNIYHEPEPDEDRIPQYQQNWLRDNRVRLQSLFDHLRGIANQSILNQWADARDTCTKYFAQLEKKATELSSRLSAEREGKVAHEVNVSGYIVGAIGQVIFDDYGLECSEQSPSTINNVQDIKEYLSPAFSQRVTKIVNDKLLYVKSSEKDIQLASALVEALLLDLDTGRLLEVISSICVINRSCGLLQDTLNPLKLYPLILRTRCELCPV